MQNNYFGNLVPKAFFRFDKGKRLHAVSVQNMNYGMLDTALLYGMIVPVFD